MRYLILSFCFALCGVVCASEDKASGWLDGGTGNSLDDLCNVSFKASESSGSHSHQTEGKQKAKEGASALHLPKSFLYIHTANASGAIFSEGVSGSLDKVADRYGAGDRVCFVFSPPLTLVHGKEEKVNLSNKPHYFDTVPITAWIRSAVKWLLNPWAWWDPGSYCLPRAHCQVEMKDGIPLIKVNTSDRDWTYLGSQVQQYLLYGDWVTNCYYPYVNNVTAYMLYFAVNRRFQEVEKKALEAVGFVDVQLARGVHPATKQLQWMIQATKE